MTEQAARELLSRASRVTGDELVRLGAATNNAMGLLQPKKAWLAALKSVAAVGEAAGKRPIIEELQAAAMDAILASALSYAESRGKDSTRVRPAFDAWKREVDERARKRRSRAFPKLQRTLVRAVGLSVQRRIGPAIFGTTAAVTALATWEYPDAGGRYTPDCRHLPHRQPGGEPTGDLLPISQ